jgi:hypothetical protein
MSYMNKIFAIGVSLLLSTQVLAWDPKEVEGLD